MKHKHYDVIVAWANGEQIQVNQVGEWCDIPTPAFNPYQEYRVKPKEVRLIPHWPAIIDLGPTARITQSVYSSIEEAKRNVPRSTSLRMVRLATEYPPIMLPEKEPILEHR